MSTNGYFLNPQDSSSYSKNRSSSSKADIKGIFGEKFIQKSKDIEFNSLQNRKLLERQDQNMIGSNTTMRNTFAPEMGGIQRPKSSREVSHREELLTKSLTGDFVRNDSFSHNNMTPFFGGSVKQNIDDGMCQTILEKYTGIPANTIEKTELKSMFPLRPENIHGTPNKTDELESRYTPSRYKQGVPLNEPIRVGPGLNKGYNAIPSGGFQQEDTRKYALPRTTNEIRVAGNEKKTYEGRVIDGFKSGRRGIQPSVSQNRAVRFHTFESPRFNTTVVQQKQASYENYSAKHTNRQDATQEYSGIAGSSSSSKAKIGIQFNKDNVHKQDLPEFGLRNTMPSEHKKGKVVYCSDIRNSQKEKETNFVGTASSLVKKLIAPVQDILRTTVRETTEDAAYPEGFVGVPVKNGIMYDTDDIARTTVRETTELNGHKGNVGIPVSKLTIYETDDVAKTTLKEQNIHDIRLGNTGKTGGKGTIPHSDKPNKTARETLKEKYSYNISKTHNKGIVYDKNNINPKTTIKETTLDADDPGLVTISKGQGYLTNPMKVVPTNKQFTSDNEYIGGAQGDQMGGYKVTNTIAPETSKQFVSDNDYTGNALSSDIKPQSYEDIYNMTINTIKEDVAKGRKPTQSAAKVSNGNVGSVRYPEEHEAQRLNNQKTKITNTRLHLPTDSITTQKDTLCDVQIADRLHPDNLSAFNENPLTKSLNSYT
jgi:hypothetical protein